ncbi:piwi-like protein 1, partial [Panonychus citri]|uniref:piwi-like protein 1 n=1 Tax=Panonychus citri TaxID=50023 RepID=UPI0023075126
SPPSAEFPPKPLSSSNVSRAAEPPLKTKPSGLLTKVGEGGIAVRLFSNHFRLQTPQDVIIYDYHVHFEPNVESLRFRRSLIFQNREMFNSSYIFDGSESIKSLHELTGPITVSAVDKHNNENIQITIKPTGRIAWGHPEMMRFYNTQMKRNLTHLSMTRLGRNFFDKNQAKRIPEHSVEVWPGVLTAINEHDGGILMVVNCLNKIIRKETALDILRRIWSQNRDNFKDYARRELAGSIVMSKYNSKTYRIDDIIFDKNPESYLFERKGESINLVTYYFTQYAIKIQDTKQPLLMVNPTDRQQRGGITKDLVLVPELCLLTGMSENMRNDFNFRKELDKHVNQYIT